MKDQLIQLYGMTAHPEGGAFVETYRSPQSVQNSEGSNRSASTAIYFLLGSGEFSAFHRIKSDEIWHFYQGDALRIVEISPDGLLKETLLGADAARGEVFQYVVPAGVWFASIPCRGPKGFSFVGCTVAPGFDFADFELASRAQLLKDYPRLELIVCELTRS